MLSTSSKWLIFAVIVGTGILVYLLAPVITPFLMGALLAYLGDPLVDRLEAKKLSRTVSVIIVFVFIFLVVLLIPVVLLPLIEQQISALATNFPKYIDWIQLNVVPFISQTFNIDPSILNTATLKQSIVTSWREVGGFAGNIVSGISKSSVVLLSWLANLVLVPVVTFYLLRDWDVMMEKIRQLLPRATEPTVVKLAKECDDVLGQFLRGQVTVMIALGIIYTVGLWIVGLDLALLVGMIAGLVSFVPYLGFIVGIVLAGIAAIMQFGDMTYLLYVAIVFGIGQALEGMLLTPLLVGDKIGLHPVAVIFAVMAGGQLFGFVGVLLALPVAAVIVVLLRHVHELYKLSEIYGETAKQADDNSS
ncbi:AI-2E family transporter [Kaarinaea lacus]